MYVTGKKKWMLLGDYIINEKNTIQPQKNLISKNQYIYMQKYETIVCHRKCMLHIKESN